MLGMPSSMNPFPLHTLLLLPVVHTSNSLRLVSNAQILTVSNAPWHFQHKAGPRLAVIRAMAALGLLYSEKYSNCLKVGTSKRMTFMWAVIKAVEQQLEVAAQAAAKQNHCECAPASLQSSSSPQQLGQSSGVKENHRLYSRHFLSCPVTPAVKPHITCQTGWSPVAGPMHQSNQQGHAFLT